MKKGENSFHCSIFELILNFLCRVALSPAVTATLVKKGFNVNIEKGAGAGAKFRDEDYSSVGGKIVDQNKAFDSGEKFSFIV